MMMIKVYSQSTDTALSERKKKKLRKRVDRLLGNLRRERKNHKLHLELGDLYATLENEKNADKHYMEAIDLLRQGEVDERARKQIIVLYGKILNLDPNNYEAYVLLAQEYVAAGQKEKASRFLLSSGKKAFENGDYELALLCYQEVIDLGKSNPYIIERCTEIFLKLGRKDDAIENYVKIGDMYAREEKTVEALEYYKKASALDPNSPELTLKVARMYYTLEWTENAAAEMVKIAEYYEQQQNVNEALKYFQHSLSLDRENDRALAGKLRITASQNLDASEEANQAEPETLQEDILDELDLIEEALKTQNFVKMDAENAETTDGEKTESPVEAPTVDVSSSSNTDAVDPVADTPVSGGDDSSVSESQGSNIIDATSIFSNGAKTAAASNGASEANETQEDQAENPDDADEFFLLDTNASSNGHTQNGGQQGTQPEEGMVWQDRLLDLNLEKDFVLETGLDDQDEGDVPVRATADVQVQSEDDAAEEPETNEALLLDGSDQAEEAARNVEGSQVSEVWTDETVTEKFEITEFTEVPEEAGKADDVVEQEDSVDNSETETLAESKLEGEKFEALPEYATGKESDRNLLPEAEKKERSSEESFTAAVSEEMAVPEEMNIDEEAEKLIEKTLSLAGEEDAEAPEPEGETHDDNKLTDAQLAEAERVEQSEDIQHDADAAENTMSKAPESLDRKENMPSTYTPVEQSDERPRTVFQGSEAELSTKLEDLEKQLENTEEEKYFLQEQFTAQISSLKSRETLIKREYDRMRRDKEGLQHRLDEVTSIYEQSRQNADERDEARYEAIVSKIQRKKQALQEHVNKLLKQREQNGRFLADELKSLGTTKQRLQSNLEYIQQVKARVEQKIQTDLRQAQEEVQRLSERDVKLQTELESRQHAERELHDRFDRLHQEKETLQDQFTETISALTEENEKLGDQLKELSKEKLETEHLLKKKFKALHLSYHRLRGEFRSSVQSKEMELNRTAQRLSQFADEYVKLETTLKEIRQERDKLERMLAQETATRERLEDNLSDIETQVDSLEVQGSELLEQLEEELDRQFTIKQSASDEFQGSLGELESLLAQQEREIQSLEVL